MMSRSFRLFLFLFGILVPSPLEGRRALRGVLETVVFNPAKDVLSAGISRAVALTDNLTGSEERREEQKKVLDNLLQKHFLVSIERLDQIEYGERKVAATADRRVDARPHTGSATGRSGGSAQDRRRVESVDLNLGNAYGVLDSYQPSRRIGEPFREDHTDTKSMLCGFLQG